MFSVFFCYRFVIWLQNIPAVETVNLKWEECSKQIIFPKSWIRKRMILQLGITRFVLQFFNCNNINSIVCYYEFQFCKQVELLQAALDNDIIVYLPTGSGKTFIAALLIKEKSSEVTPSLAMKGRRTVFLVPTVVLAIQQANYLRRHTHLEVKEYYGSMGVDLWSKNQ